jgi:membrane associated rhomboid family serine protease
VSSGADLFVVCKQCGSEVSPYITECPYCGHRLRRRAPKLPKVGSAAEAKPHRQGLGSLLGRGSRPSRSGRARTAAKPARLHSDRWVATRPYATIVLVFLGCACWIAAHAEPELLTKAVVAPEIVVRNGSLTLLGGLHGDWWRIFTTQFFYLEGVYAFVAILAVAVFGWLVERRYGPLVVLALFFGAGAVGVLVDEAVYTAPIVSGANAGALALIACWAAPDVRARRAGHFYEGDLLGAGAFAALLLAAPFARPEASWLSGVIGALMGLLVGLGIARPARAEI